MSQRSQRALVLAASVTLVRLAFSASRAVPSTLPDEPAQLAIARWLSGNTPWSMFDHSTWQPGFAVLLVPAYWLTDSPELIFRVALAFNAVLGGVAAVLLARLLTYVTPIGDRTAWIISLVIAVMPASLAASSRAWAEPIVTVIALACLHLALRAIDRVSARHGVAGLFVAGAGYLVHGRLLPLLPFMFCVLAVVLIRDRRWPELAGAVGLTALVVVATELFTRWVIGNVWTDPESTNSVGSTLRRFTQVGDLLDSVLGQVWYQLVATLMLVGLGFWVVVRVALGSSAPDVLPVRSHAGVLLGLTLPLMGVSMLFMAGRDRPDYQIYGRYNDAVLWPVLAIGVVWMLAALRSDDRTPVIRSFGSAIAMSLVLTALVEIRSGDALAGSGTVRLMVAGVSAATGPDAVVTPWIVCAVSVTLTIVVVTSMAARARLPVMALLTVGAALLGMGVRTWVVTGANRNPLTRVKIVREVDDIVPPGEPIGYHFVPRDEPSLVLYGTQREMAQLYQMYLPDHEFLLDDGLDDDVGPYVFAPKAHQPLVDAGAEVLWQDERSGMTLFLEPSRP